MEADKPSTAAHSQGRGAPGPSLRPLPEALGVLCDVKEAVVAGQLKSDGDDGENDAGDGADDDDGRGGLGSPST